MGGTDGFICLLVSALLPRNINVAKDEALEGLKGVYSIADNMLIGGVGNTYEEAVIDHDKNVHAFLLRCRDKNLKLNKSKMQLHQVSVPFIGHVLTSDGLLPSSTKVDAILQMPTPVDVSGIRRLLGRVNYLSKFVNNLSNICETLRILMQKNTAWHWGQA